MSKILIWYDYLLVTPENMLWPMTMRVKFFPQQTLHNQPVWQQANSTQHKGKTSTTNILTFQLGRQFAGPLFTVLFERLHSIITKNLDSDLKKNSWDDT